MTAIREGCCTRSSPRLQLAFELGWSQWKLAFTIGHGQPPRLRTIGARNLPTLLKEIGKAKRRFGLPDDAAVVSCYEAGRDGFWLHRWLTSQGITNVIVDSASTPYQSGDCSREQGISKAGNRMVRRMLVELAWAWLRWQPDSELSQWYQRRFAYHGKRARKVGIVALARKLLIALWRFVEQGEVPMGARLVSWRAKVNAKASATISARAKGGLKVEAA